MITERVSHFVSEISSSDIPQEAFEYARMGITDFIGVALAGSKEEAGNIIADCVQEMGGTASAGVMGKGFKTSSYLAALANGTMGHALDYDDMSFTYNAHPSVTLAPVVLAIGESLGASGKDVLTAYIVGFESGGYISSPVAQSHYMQGWHSTGTAGTMGATAAAARMLKLDVPQTIKAFGIAASMAGGLRHNFGTMAKPFHAGNAAASGTLSALLAHRGFTANDSIIEAPVGYARVLGCSDEIDWDKASANLGKTFILAKSGIGFKPYPSCGGTLGVADAALYLRNQHKPDLSMIEEIVLGVGPFENRTTIHNPTRGLEGKFSMEYCTCRILLDGKLVLPSFADDMVNQPEVRRLMKITKCVERYPMATMGVDASGVNPQSVTIRMRDGTEYFRETPMHMGMPVSPMTTEQFEGKYRYCASLALDERAVERSLSLLRDLESLDNIQGLMKIIAKTSIEKGGLT